MLIRTKLLIGFFVLLLLFVISAYSSRHSVQMYDRGSKQIQDLDSGTLQILESALAIRRFVDSQSQADADAARAAMHESARYIKQAIAYDMDAQQAQRANKLLRQIENLQVLFKAQEQEIQAMKATVVEAIDASGKAFTAITTIVDVNVENLRIEALPRRIEAASHLDKVKGFFLLGRNQFTSYRLTNADAAITECLRLLDEALKNAEMLKNYFAAPRQLEQVAVTLAAVANYKQSFEKFVVVQKRMRGNEDNVYKLVEVIRAESKSIITDANRMLERTQAEGETLTLSVTGVAILVAILVACWIILSITRPLTAALNFAQQVASGDFAARWQYSRSDEFGKLSVSLNKAFGFVADKAFWYESILNSLPFLLATMDTEKRFTFANIHVQGMLNKSLGELVGQPCHTWGASICSTDNCAIKCIKDGKSEVPFEQPGMGHFKAIAVELRDKNQKRMGYVDMVFDVNEEVRLKNEAAAAIANARMQTVSAVEKIIANLNTAVEGLSQQVNETNDGTEQSAQRIAEIATSMEEMNSTVLEAARSAGAAASVTIDAKSKAEQGALIVNDVVHCIAEVEGQSTQLKTDMLQLGKQAESIGAIMNVISDIADQTNLLALNAAIEAARAGDAGRGFAVVADEVRKLAEKTMQATVEVGTAIQGVQKSVEMNMTGVDASSRSIAQATSLVNQAGEALKEIVDLVEVSADQVRTIATAVEQQSATSEEINRALGTVNISSTETARSMEEAARSVSDLSYQTLELAGVIDEMRRG